MKYIKTYENVNNPKIGDWVLCDIKYKKIFPSDIKELQKNNLLIDSFAIGELVNIEKLRGENKETYWINFHTAPLGQEEEEEVIYGIYRNDIKHYGKDKEELEAKLWAEKYNL